MTRYNTMMADFSPCQRYRYRLLRNWGSGPTLCFVGLNPSTADHREDDPTIRRVVAYAKAWGFGGLQMVNLFAYRATDPLLMMGVEDPVGPQGDLWLGEASHICQLTVCGFGNKGMHRGRIVDVLNKKLLNAPHFLELTKDGWPKHPLYLRGDLQPQRWKLL